MARRKRTPEERAELEARLAQWAEEERQFAELVERFGAQFREQKERRERRSRLLRRLVPFV